MFCLLLGLTGCADEEKDESATIEKPKPLVTTADIREVSSEYTINGQGFLKPAEQVTVVSEVSGTVEWISDELAPGNLLNQGTELFRIEQATYVAERDRAKADIDSAQAALDDASTSLERLDYLAEIGAAAEAQRDTAEAAKEAAAASLARAEAQYVLAQERLDDTTLIAPFDARVIDESVTLGMYLAPGTPVATLFDVSSGEIVVGLQFEDAQAVQRAMSQSENPLSVTIFRDGRDAQQTGKLIAMDPQVDETARTVSFRIAVPNAFNTKQANRLLVNEFLNVAMPAMSEATLYQAPEGVVRREQFIFLVDDSEILRRADVKPLKREEGSVVFSSSADLNGKRALVTSLSQEQDGLQVKVDSGSAATTQESND